METTDEVIQEWKKHRLVLHELLDLVDDENKDFKPWDGAMTLGELALHIATSTDMFIKLVKSGEFTAPNEETYKSIDDIRDLVKKYTDFNERDLKMITKSQMTDEVDFNGQSAPGRTFLSMAIDHEIHHKGQLFTYVRMIGAKDMPSFVKSPSEV